MLQILVSICVSKPEYLQKAESRTERACLRGRKLFVSLPYILGQYANTQIFKSKMFFYVHHN